MKTVQIVTGVGLATLMVCLPILGCGHANSQIQLTVLESDAISGLGNKEAEFKVISDPQAFADIYRQTHAHKLDPPNPPRIDFSTQLVLVALMGRQSTAGYGIRFESPPTLEGDTLLVTVSMQTPPAGAILPQVITSPYSMATVDRGDYNTVTFVDQKGQRLSSVPVP